MSTLLVVGRSLERDERLFTHLRSRGFAVENVEEAEDLDDFEPEQTSAVVVELGAARGDAFALMYRLRRALPRMPIVAVAPFRDVVVEQHARRCGATVVLVEPVNASDLAAFIAGCAELARRPGRASAQPAFQRALARMCETSLH